MGVLVHRGRDAEVRAVLVDGVVGTQDEAAGIRLEATVGARVVDSEVRNVSATARPLDQPEHGRPASGIVARTCRAAVLSGTISVLRDRRDLALENLALRQPLREYSAYYAEDRTHRSATDRIRPRTGRRGGSYARRTVTGQPCVGVRASPKAVRSGSGGASSRRSKTTSTPVSRPSCSR